jgi:hypothetical protein
LTVAEFPPFDVWEFHLEYLGEVVVDGRLSGREGTQHPAEAVRVSDERRGGVFHVYALHPASDGDERVVLGRRFDQDEPQLMTPRTDVASYRLTSGVKREATGCSMLYRVAGPWRGEGEGWTAVGGERAEDALAGIGGSAGLLTLLTSVPGSEEPRLIAGSRGTRVLFETGAIAGPVAFWCMTRLMPLVTHVRTTGLLPEPS